MARFIRTVVQCAIGGVFGAFMANLGYGITTIEWWAAMSLLVALQITCSIK